ncbi:hypothetical protein D9619_004944 [Psilocybe cf. subviscida]|uniref:chitin deacetylase n=1 Tax=Psilocybe cf. subviscida TaxID=2480587 RepID=A0A8H5F8U4_9AGAR|nr:hypothetical protein D9619_004944 [Psilocybe cf. subviscida]
MIRALLRASLLSLPVSLVYAARATEGDEAGIKDPNAECASYGYAPVTNAINAGQFPPIWTPATLLPNDADANAKWQSIQGSVPNIAPKGTNAGDFSGVHYTNDDPDCWWTFSKCTTSKKAGIAPDIAQMPEPQTLGYGFDDGPNCSHNAFYDFLTQQNQKATMFYIGSNVMDFPLEAQRAITDVTSFSNTDAFAELYYSVRIVPLPIFDDHRIKGYFGMRANLGRTKIDESHQAGHRCDTDLLEAYLLQPPFGDIDDRIRAIAQGLGLRTVIWKYDSDDWQFGTGNVTVANIDANYQTLITDAKNGKFATAGTIILTHELNNFTMSEAIKMYPQLKAAFKSIVPVGVGLNVSQPYQELNYTLPSFAQYTAGQTTLSADPASISAAQAAKATNTAASPASPLVASQANNPASVGSTAPSTTPSVHKSGAEALRLGGVPTILLGFVGAVLLGSS